MSVGNFEEAFRRHVDGVEPFERESLEAFKESYGHFGAVEFSLSPRSMIELHEDQAVLEFDMIGEEHIYYTVRFEKGGGFWKVAGKPQLVTLEPL